MGIANKALQVYNKILTKPSVKTLGKAYDKYWDIMVGLRTEEAAAKVNKIRTDLKKVYGLKKTQGSLFQKKIYQNKKFQNAKQLLNQRRWERAGTVAATGLVGGGLIKAIYPSGKKDN